VGGVSCVPRVNHISDSKVMTHPTTHTTRHTTTHPHHIKPHRTTSSQLSHKVLHY
jgi:hypothetical protein